MLGAKLQVAPLLLLLAAVLSAPSGLAQSRDDEVRAALGELREASFADKERIAERLNARGDPSVRPVLAALLDDRLFARQSDQRLFIVSSADDSLAVLQLIDPLTQADAGSAPRDELVKIGTNNRLRKRLRALVARFDLASPDAAVRLAAVEEILRSLDEESLALLRARSAIEPTTRVKEQIDVGLALAALDSSDSRARRDAVAVLARQLTPQVRNRLTAVLDRSVDGTFVEGDEQVRRAAANAVRRIDRMRAFYGTLETMFFGLSVGSVLVLVAVGLAITFGVMGVINMAHGELMMLGAYTTYVMQNLFRGSSFFDLYLVAAIPMAFLASAAVGMALERSVIRWLYGRPLETLLSTWGISLILMFTLIVFVILMTVLKRTRLGLYIRAVSQNRAMARAMGVRTAWVDALTFGLGSGIAGIAGVALSQFTNVGPNLGQSYIIDSFMVVVFGGVGNLWGTLVGGLSMGVLHQWLEPYAGAVLAKICVLVALIVFIQRWPRGLFPPTGRAAESQA